jgi:hypothetical protein
MVRKLTRPVAFWGTALQAAVYQGHLEIAKLLLAYRADVNVFDGVYGTVLRTAERPAADLKYARERRDKAPEFVELLLLLHGASAALVGLHAPHEGMAFGI